MIDRKVLDSWQADANYMNDQIKKVHEDPAMGHIKAVLELWMVIVDRQLVLIEELKGSDSIKRVIDL